MNLGHQKSLLLIIALTLKLLIQEDAIYVFIQVVIADESHFLKNAQAKRTTASLPVIKVLFFVLDGLTSISTHTHTHTLPSQR